MLNIRNVAIIAHVDHGKSTLADRLIQYCQGLPDKQMQEQVLDSMDIERERGITIKAQSVSLYTQYKNTRYQINIIDTPGHSDFSYEVSRSLSSCEGVILVIDAVDGVCSQTISHLQVALDYNLNVIVAINKIDLPAADISARTGEVLAIPNIGNPCIVSCSAKYNIGIEDLMAAIINNIKPPQNDISNPLQVRIIDSWFDKYLGVISLIRVCAGVIHKHDKVTIASNNHTAKVQHLGIFTPHKTNQISLSCGQIGFIGLGLKDVRLSQVGDTILDVGRNQAKPLDGFIKPAPQVFACLFPKEAQDFRHLKDALNKLALNDASLQFRELISNSLGSGFQCGFLGLLHMDIARERLSREYKSELIMTPPTVEYQCKLKNGSYKLITNVSDLPSAEKIEWLEEGFSEVNITAAEKNIGDMNALCQSRRGNMINMQVINNMVKLVYELPFIEVIKDLSEQLKAICSGYCTIDYQKPRFRRSDLKLFTILLNDEVVDTLSMLVHTKDAARLGKNFVLVLKNSLPREMFAIKIQAMLGNKVIAREDISALRKNVTAKCYGGDVTRKNKLLQRQKAGKKYRAQFSTVKLPKTVFISLLKANS